MSNSIELIEFVVFLGVETHWAVGVTQHKSLGQGLLPPIERAGLAGLFWTCHQYLKFWTSKESNLVAAN